MDQIQLKMQPDKVARMAYVLENWIDNNPDDDQTRDVEVLVNWLRYRLDRWHRRHPTTPAA